MSGGELLVAWKLNDLDCSLQSSRSYLTAFNREIFIIEVY